MVLNTECIENSHGYLVVKYKCSTLHALNVFESAGEAWENSHSQGSNLTPLRSIYQTLAK